MQKEVFRAKAEQMGLFYVYYKKGTKQVYGICTHEVTEDYMQPSTKNLKIDKDSEVLLWNFKYNNRLVLKYRDIKKMTPMSVELNRNGKQRKF